jgi:hypothetical protein
MTVRAKLQRLHADVGALGDALVGLRRRAADTPPDRELQLAQSIADAADTMAGWAREARDAIGTGAPADATQASERVSRVHERVLRIARHLDELTSYGAIADIVAAGQEGGRAWRDWAIDVRDALDAAHEALARTERRVLAAWQEIAEASAARGVSVSAVNVGPHVALARTPEQDPLTPGGETSAVGS